MENISIRRASTNDLSAIQRLNNELFEPEYSNYDSTLVLDWPFLKVKTARICTNMWFN